MIRSCDPIYILSWCHVGWLWVIFDSNVVIIIRNSCYLFLLKWSNCANVLVMWPSSCHETWFLSRDLFSCHVTWSCDLQEEESVSNRVAGFICKYILTEHKSCVTSMCVVHKAYGFDNTYLVSGGWDHKLCIWNLDDGR